jgi:hypothetical protein
MCLKAKKQERQECREMPLQQRSQMRTQRTVRSCEAAPALATGELVAGAMLAAEVVALRLAVIYTRHQQSKAEAGVCSHYHTMHFPLLHVMIGSVMVISSFCLFWRKYRSHDVGAVRNGRTANCACDK